MAFNKITSDDMLDKGVVGLPDTPALSTQAMQEKFEEVSSDVIIPHFNELVGHLEEDSGAADLGAKVPDQFSAASNLQSILNALATAILNRPVKEPGKGLSTNDYSDTEMSKVADNTAARHAHGNKTLLDSITSGVKQGYDNLVEMLKNVSRVTNEVENSASTLPTGEAVVKYVQDHGGGGGGGVAGPTAAFFTMRVTGDGDLYVDTIDGAEQPPFRYDSSTGDLYWDAP